MGLLLVVVIYTVVVSHINGNVAVSHHCPHGFWREWNVAVSHIKVSGLPVSVPCRRCGRQQFGESVLLRGSQRLQVPKVASPLNCEVCVAQSGAFQVRGALRSEVLDGCSAVA